MGGNFTDVSKLGDSELDSMIAEQLASKRPEDMTDEELDFAIEYQQSMKKRQASVPDVLSDMALSVPPKQPVLIPKASKTLQAKAEVNDLGGWFDKNVMEPARKAKQQQDKLGVGEYYTAKGHAFEQGVLDVADVVPTLYKAGLEQIPAGPVREYVTDLIPYARAGRMAKDFIDWEKKNIEQRTKGIRQKAPDFYNQYKDLTTNLAPLGADLAMPLASAMSLKAPTLIPRMAEQAGVGASSAGLMDMSQQYNESHQIDPIRSALVAGGGALLGGATGAGATAVENLVARAAKLFKKMKASGRAPSQEGLLQQLLDQNLELDQFEREALQFKDVPEASLQGSSAGPVSTAEVPAVSDPHALWNEWVKKGLVSSQYVDDLPSQPSAGAQPAEVPAAVNPLEQLMQDLENKVNEYKAQKAKPSPPEPLPDVLPEGEFRYRTDAHGRKRLEAAVHLDDSPVPLSDQEKAVIQEILTAKSKRDYDAARLKAYELAFMQQHAPGQKEFVHRGVKVKLDSSEPNWTPQQQDILYRRKQHLADGVKDEKATDDYIRGLGEADYGQARGDYPVEPPPVPTDLDEATTQLLMLKYQLDGLKTNKNQRLLGAADIDGSDKVYDALREKNRELLLGIQDRLRQQQDDPLARLFLRSDFPHPEGIQRGNVEYGIEIQQGQRQLQLSPDGRQQFDTFQQNFMREEIPVTSEQWGNFINQASLELQQKGKFAPWPEVQKRALQIAKSAGFDLERVPYKTNVGLDQRKADGPFKFQTLMKYARQGSAMALVAGATSNGAAQAADGQDRQNSNLPGWFYLAGGLAAVAGGKNAYKLLRNPNIMREAAQTATRLPVLWRDTMDQIDVLDKALRKARQASQQPKAQQLTLPFFKKPGASASIGETIWKHSAAAIQTTWGVKFDNPEQMAMAWNALKRGDVTPEMAMKPGQHDTHRQVKLDDKIYNPFQDLSPAQRAALVRKYVVAKSLKNKIAQFDGEIQEMIKSGALKDEGQVKDALHAFEFAKSALNPTKEPNNVASNVLSKATENVMDFLFMWNPEHHLTNLTDQFIAGSSRVGLYNIAHANILLGPGGDKELKQLFETSNLVGGYRAERAEAVATRPAQAPSKWQMLKNTDLPSDRINADRVALGALLEHFGNSNSQRVKDFFNGKLSADETAEAWMHMTERLSRTLGVDPFRLNQDMLSRMPGANKLMSFFRQPARLNRLLINNIGTGNVSGVFTTLGMTAMLGGRAAIPKDFLFDGMQSLAPEQYFQVAAWLDQNANLYEKVTGENNASKLQYGLMPGSAIGMAAGNIGAEVSSEIPQLMGEAIDGIAKIQKKLGNKSWEQLTPKELAELSRPYRRLTQTASMLAFPRVNSVPMRLGLKVTDAADATMNDQLPITYYEQGSNRPYYQKDVIRPSQFKNLIPLADPFIAGTPTVVDQFKQARLEESKMKKRNLIPRNPAYRKPIARASD